MGRCYNLGEPEDLPVNDFFNQIKLSGDKVMVIKVIFRTLVLFFLLFGCNTASKKDAVLKLFEGQEPDSVYTPSYAQGFSIHYYNNIKLVHINDPWNSSAPGTHILVGPANTADKYTKGDIPFIEYPVTNWSAFSSTQVVFADRLGVLKTLKSVAEPQYISNEYIHKRIKSGLVRDVGLANAADLEVLLEATPQFVFVSPFKDNRYGSLEEAELTLINDAGYLESTPLGRAEWFVFFSTFFNKENEALNIFKNIEKRYKSIKQKAKTADKNPTILTGTLFNGVWYMPAGDSYMASLFADAGGHYAYKNKPGTGSLSLDFETVFNDFRTSDFWVLTINEPAPFTNSDFLQMDERYADFKAFQNGTILFSNTNHSMFFERGILEPDVVLKDLAASFHPNLFPHYSPVYFEFLKD